MGKFRRLKFHLDISFFLQLFKNGATIIINVIMVEINIWKLSTTIQIIR